MEERRSPLISQLVLWSLFVILAAVSIFTVLIPEISGGDEPEESAETAE